MKKDFLGNNPENKIAQLIEKHYGFMPYKEQLKAGAALSKEKIVNQHTGEGKTISILIGVLFLLNQGHKVYVVTANDYLSKRDYEDSKKLYEELGLVSVFFAEGIGGSTYAYKNADVIYATGHTLIFDYLRGIKADYDAVIIDEIDYILVECANHDFSVSTGDSKVSMPKELFDTCLRLSELFTYIEKTAKTKEEDLLFDYNKQYDYIVDKVLNQVSITTRGYLALEKMFGEETDNLLLIDILHATLTVKHFYRKNEDYIIEDGRLIIIDSASGRKSPNSSNELLIQTAIEEKEGLPLTDKDLLHNTCSYTVFFTLFKKLSGISGTTSFVPYDFMEIYGKETIKIKDHYKSRRQEFYEEYETDKERLKRVKELTKAYKDPVLIITDSDMESHELFRELMGIKERLFILDNNDLEDEEGILSQIQHENTILISSKIVGRGTDIKVLNDWDELIVIIPRRLYSERAERQAIGRTGRNGRKGTAYILSSKEDEIYKLAKGSRESIKALQDRYEQMQFMQRKHIYLRNKIFFDLDRQVVEFFETLSDYETLFKIAKESEIEIAKDFFNQKHGPVSDYYRDLLLYVYKKRCPVYQSQYIYYNDVMPRALYDNTFHERVKENALFFKNIIAEVALISLAGKFNGSGQERIS